MVLRTRTSCSLRCRECMELRCAWRSTNISETSKFGYSIRYILRLMVVSSTENAQCGVLPPVRIILLKHKHRFKPCCTAHEDSRVRCSPAELFLQGAWERLLRLTR